MSAIVTILNVLFFPVSGSKKIVRVSTLFAVMLIVAFFINTSHAQSVIVQNSFESGSTWSISPGSYGTVSWVSFGLSTSDISSDGTYSWYVANSVNTQTFANINLAGYKNVEFHLDLMGFDLYNPYHDSPGSDDSVVVSLSTNGGSTWSRELKVTGSGSYDGYYYGYSSTATVTPDMNNSPTLFSSGNYSELVIDIPSSYHQISVRVTAGTNATTQAWALDYARLVGTAFATNLDVSSLNNGATISAGEPFAVTVHSIGSAGTEISVAATTTVTLTRVSGTGTLSGTTTGQITAGNSSVTFTGLTYSTAESGVKFAATASGGDTLKADTTSSQTVLSGATHLVITGFPDSVLQGSAASSFKVQALRTDNSTDSNYTSTITVSKATGPSGGALTGTLAVSAVHGSAVFGNVRFDSTGNYTLNAAGSGVTGAVSNSIKVVKSQVSATTGTTTNITGSGATLSSSVNTYGGEAFVHFEFGTDTTYGASTTADTVDDQGEAITLNPSQTQYVLIPNNSSLDFSEYDAYTIEAWINVNNFTWLGGVAGKYQNGGSNGYFLRLLGSGDYRGLDFDGMTTDDDILNQGQWYHLAAVNENGTRHLYINGVEQTLHGSSSGVDNNSDPFVIGADFLASPRPFDGSIDEVRMWNVALTQTQILSTMNRKLTGSESGLVSSWSFEEGSGSSVSDLKGVNNGTLTNGGTWTNASRPFQCSATVTGLNPLTTYHYRIYATNPSGTSRGADSTFTTLNAPSFNYGGGSDTAGGYYFANSEPGASSAPSHPVFNWISDSTASVLNPADATDSDDGYWPAIPLPFPFPFFGSSKTQIFVGTNGILSFDNGIDDNGESIPNNTVYNYIALAWDDMITDDTPISVTYQGDSTRFVVTYNHLETYDDNSIYVTAQAVLYPDGSIKFQYNDSLSNMKGTSFENSNSIGIQDSDGTAYLAYRVYGVGGPMFGSNLAVMFGLNPTTLPIQLETFAGAAQGLSNVHLQWQTLTEKNNYGFYVERKESAKATYKSISKLIPGAGTSLEEHSYAWDDHSANTGSYFYRLKQVNLDGTFAYSSEIKVIAGVMGVNGDETAPREFKLLNNFPNPFNPTTTIKFSVAQNEHANVSIYNILGQRVAVVFDNLAQAGRYYDVTFDASALSSGVYYYRVVTPSHSDIKKMMLVK